MTTSASLAAPAKINLTLHIVGQRDDGYHLLDSLVAFTKSGDDIRLQLAPHRDADDHQLSITGPFGDDIETGADNLVFKAARLFGTDLPALDIHLTKNLPVASGIGGGSADAAATLKAISKLLRLPQPSEKQIVSLGADVPVCMNSHTVRMGGIGEELSAIPALPHLYIVLANPRIGVSTPDIFKTLENKNNAPLSAFPSTGWETSADFIEWLKHGRNDLQATAIKLCPTIETCLNAIADLKGVVLHRMSGSGATCFGLFSNESDAHAAADTLKAEHPDWWVMASSLH